MQSHSAMPSSLIDEAADKQLYEQLGIGLVIAGSDGVISYANNALCKLTLYASTELVGQDIAILLSDDLAKQHAGFIAAYQQSRKPMRNIIGQTRKLVVKRKDGKKVPIELRLLEMDNGQFVAQINDQSQFATLNRAFDELKLEQTSLLSMLDIGVVILSNKRELISVNKWMQDKWKEFSADHLNLENFYKLYTLYDEHGMLIEDAKRPTTRALAGEIISGERLHIVSSDLAFDEWYIVNASPYIDSKSAVHGVFMTFTEITELIEAKHREVLHAHTDPLTGLLNRTHLMSELNKLCQVTDLRAHHAAIHVDISNFKDVNKTHGHKVGDKALIAYARKIENCLKHTDMLARNGADQFIAVVKHIGDNKKLAAQRALSIAERIQTTVNESLHIGQTVIEQTCHIGIAVFPDIEKNAEDILYYADVALTQSKQQARHGITLFNQKLNDVIQFEVSLNKMVHQAVKDRLFYPVFQPQVQNKRGYKIVGAEALMRCKLKDGTRISPEQFIPVLESSGDIIKVGEDFIEACFARVKKWQDGQRWPLHFSLAINVSALQMKEASFVECLRDLHIKYEIDPKDIVLEITESVFLDTAMEHIEAIKEMGFRLSLDDFGTGYSSLSYLNRMPFDQIKIDKSFIYNLSSCSSSKHLVEAIIALSKPLNVRIVAEGVETEEHERILKPMHCHYLQGFYYAKPMEEKELMHIIDEI